MDRRLEPYGLVLKAGRWYLVAGPGPRTYRVDQILDLTPLKESLTIPESFSLAGYWQSYTADFLAGLHRADAVVRLTPAAVARLTGRDADAVAATGIPGTRRLDAGRAPDRGRRPGRPWFPHPRRRGARTTRAPSPGGHQGPCHRGTLLTQGFAW